MHGNVPRIDRNRIHLLNRPGNADPQCGRARSERAVEKPAALPEAVQLRVKSDKRDQKDVWYACNSGSRWLRYPKRTRNHRSVMQNKLKGRPRAGHCWQGDCAARRPGSADQFGWISLRAGRYIRCDTIAGPQKVKILRNWRNRACLRMLPDKFDPALTRETAKIIFAGQGTPILRLELSAQLLPLR